MGILPGLAQTRVEELNPARFRKLREIFEEALHQRPESLEEFLQQACSDDPGMLGELRSLLASHRESDSFLQTLPLFESDSPLAEGQSVGPYVVRREISRGGMGIVYLAEDTRLQRPVALKALTPKLLLDQRQQERFRREARLAASLSHPAIATVFALEEVEGRFYIVSEYVSGNTLRRELQKGRFQVEQVLHSGLQMAEGLAAAHEMGIVHRDLKPENVICSSRGQLKIVDFGLALIPGADPPHQRLTQAGVFLGTPAYMSPEQLQGDPIDFRSDIFSFGVILYELASGKHPFQGANAIATIVKITGNEPPPLESLPTFAPELNRLIESCLRKSPDQRCQSIREVADNLQALTHSGKAEGFPSVKVAPNAEPSEVETGEVRLRSHWWVVHQTLVLLLYGVMVGVLWQVKETDQTLFSLLAFFAALAGAIANGAFRVHFLFTWRFNRTAILEQISRFGPWVRGIDWAFTAVLLAAAVGVFRHHLLAGVLLAVATAYLVVFLVVEPTTVRAVFSGGRETDG